MSYNIAIDGPAGAGKSTIAKAVALKLGYIYVDTGAMYRAIALYFLRHRVDIKEPAEVENALSCITIHIAYQDGIQQILLNGENVTKWLRKEDVGNMASAASALPAVRAKLLKLQQDLAAANHVVMDGRDIGTTVLPKADVKIYLTASTLVRARRRCMELEAKGETADIRQIEADIKQRDTQDMNREISPLKMAADAYLVDSSDMNIDEVINTILDIVENVKNTGRA